MTGALRSTGHHLGVVADPVEPAHEALLLLLRDGRWGIEAVYD